jgi:hypothetical protein
MTARPAAAGDRVYVIADPARAATFVARMLDEGMTSSHDLWRLLRHVTR